MRARQVAALPSTMAVATARRAGGLRTRHLYLCLVDAEAALILGSHSHGSRAECCAHSSVPMMLVRAMGGRSNEHVVSSCIHVLRDAIALRVLLGTNARWAVGSFEHVGYRSCAVEGLGLPRRVLSVHATTTMPISPHTVRAVFTVVCLPRGIHTVAL